MRGKYQEVVPRAEEEDNNTDSSSNLFSNSQWDDISSVIPIFSAEFISWVCLSPPLPVSLLIAVAASPELLLFSIRLVQADEMQTDLSKMDKKNNKGSTRSLKDQDILHSSHKNPSATLRSVM